MQILFDTLTMNHWAEQPDDRCCQAIEQWLETPRGQWARAHSQNIRTLHGQNMTYWVTVISIVGEVDGPALTEYYLRWPR
jgi:hypothetical protein